MTVKAKVQEIPFSRGLPVIGHLLDYQKDRIKLLTSLRENLGPRFKLKIGPKTLCVVTSPEDVKHLMQTNMKNYYKRTNFDQLFGVGLFTTNGEEWKTQRKMVQPLFGPRYIESCAGIILDSAKTCLNAHLTEKNGTDIYDLYARATFDVIIKTIIGIDYSHKFEELNFALNYISDYLTKANYLPIDPPEWMNPGKRKFEECRQLLDSIIYESIEAQKARENRKDSSMISLLLAAQEESAERGIDYDDKRIRDNIITLMFAGFETSALTLSWMSCILAEKAELQEELFDEIKDLDLENSKVKDFADYPLLDAVVNESMRLFPVGWAWTRIAAEDDLMNGMKVKRGDIFLISPYLTQRDKDVWERPEDFDHTRFLKGSPIKPFTLFPFGGGPRICVGKQFGTIEIKLMLVQIMKEYKFSNAKIPTPAPMATLRSKEGFKVTLEKRSTTK